MAAVTAQGVTLFPAQSHALIRDLKKAAAERDDLAARLEAIQKERDRLKEAVSEFYDTLMGESYWEAADALANRFPFLRGGGEG